MSPSDKLNVVQHHNKTISIKRACELLHIPRSSYYEQTNRKPSKQKQANELLDQKILAIYLKSKKRYGAPKIYHELLKQGEEIGLKRVQKRMRFLGIRSIVFKKWKPTSSSKQPVKERENLLNQNSKTTCINQKWVTDITYIPTGKDGWVYLSTILDLHSRKIIAWDLGKTMETSLVQATLEKAVATNQVKKGLIIHSDLGSQYTSTDYEKQLCDVGIKHSYSKKGCPYDNACIESFHSVLKKEEVYQNHYSDFNQAKRCLFEYIEGFYNRNRIHSAINYLTPVEKEQSCLDSLSSVRRSA